MFANSDRDMLRYQLEKRVGTHEPQQPASYTKLFLQKQKAEAMAQQAKREYQEQLEAVEVFMKVLCEHNVDELEYIDKEELRNALEDEEFLEDYYRVLFGDNANLDTIFDMLDADHNGKITFYEFLQFIESKGVRMQHRFNGYGRGEVKSFKEFLTAILNTVCFQATSAHFKPTDLDRTIGVNTGHVGTLDFNFEADDMDFAVARGYNATKACLQYLAYNKPCVVSRKYFDCL